MCTAARGKEIHRNVTEETLAQAGNLQHGLHNGGCTAQSQHHRICVTLAERRFAKGIPLFTLVTETEKVQLLTVTQWINSQTGKRACI